jgi:hypothetical protein
MWGTPASSRRTLRPWQAASIAAANRHACAKKALQSTPAARKFKIFLSGII